MFDLFLRLEVELNHENIQSNVIPLCEKATMS